MPRQRAVAIASCAAAGFSPAAAQLAVRETSLGVRHEGMVPHTLEVSAAMRLRLTAGTWHTPRNEQTSG